MYNFTYLNISVGKISIVSLNLLYFLLVDLLFSGAMLGPVYFLFFFKLLFNTISDCVELNSEKIHLQTRAQNVTDILSNISEDTKQKQMIRWPAPCFPLPPLLSSLRSPEPDNRCEVSPVTRKEQRGRSVSQVEPGCGK